MHEVAARFDDEDEYVAKALGEPPMRRSAPARGSPAIPSSSPRLFDDGGVLRGIRMVSDPRATPAERRMAHLLGVAVINRYGTDGWTCTDLPPARRRVPGRRRVHQAALRKDDAGAGPEVETHFLRKPGAARRRPGNP